MPWTKVLAGIGDRFGRWVIVDTAPPAAYKNQVRWLCQCDCGTMRVVAQAELRRRHGRSTSCGCLGREQLAASQMKHGASRTAEYKIWVSMKGRVLNPNAQRFRHYGGRGIKVCERWQSFENFIADMGWRPGTGFTLERVDNDGDYCPENCKWIPAAGQYWNMQRTPRFTIDGVTLTLREWAAVYKADYRRTYCRVRSLGWDVVKALSAPAPAPRGTKYI